MIIFLWEKLTKIKTTIKSVLCVSIVILLIIGLTRMINDNEEQVLAKENLRMYSGSYALIDADTGRLLIGKNETDAMANASTTKILTCIVALENCGLEEVVTISANAASQPKVRLGMGEGETYPLKDMLYGLMLESYNDCAVAIAEHVSGSEEAFATLLNNKAKEIGCLDTYFITPNGLDAEDEIGFHHTTATDLSRIMAYCTWESPAKDMFLQITQTRSYTGNANGNTYIFTNRNIFLDQMEGVVSGKTGFTAKAGYCYVAAYEKDGERYCISLLACGWPNNKNYKWQDARTLLTFGETNYDVQNITIDSIAESIQVDGYINDADFFELNKTFSLKAKADAREYQILMSEDEYVKKEIILYTDVDFPIEKEQVVGVCNLYIEDVLLDSYAIVSESASDKWNLIKIIEVFWVQFLTFSS